LSLRHRISIATITLVLIFSNPLSMARAQQRSAASDTTQIVDTVKALFTAASTDDLAKFDSLVTPGFYMYDGGARFNGESIMALIKADHAAGRHYEWNVTQPDVHISGDTAWIAYVNEGSVTDASGTQHLKWLESAFLKKDAGAWRIAFFHSTRVPPPPQENHSK
jgi:hypothetical protein